MKAIADGLVARLRAAVRDMSGSAIRASPDTLVGPLIDEAAFDGMHARSAAAGRRAASRRSQGGIYVRPAIVEVDAQEGMRPAGNVRADPLCPALSRFRRGDRAQQ